MVRKRTRKGKRSGYLYHSFTVALLSINVHVPRNGIGRVFFGNLKLIKWYPEWHQQLIRSEQLAKVGLRKISGNNKLKISDCEFPLNEKVSKSGWG